MLFLGLTEDGLDDDLLFIIIDLHRLGLFSIEAWLAHDLCMTNKQLTELALLLFEIVRSDLV